MIDPLFMNELFTLRQISKVLWDKSKKEEIVSKLDTKEEVKFIENIDATLRNTFNLLTEYLTVYTLPPDEFLCNPSEEEIYSDCVFDNPKVECDKIDLEGKPIKCKEECPYWKKFKDIKKV